jgi:anti-anti-sigma factor
MAKGVTPLENMRFTFADTIAGYVTDFDPDNDIFGLRTSDGREFQVKITATAYAELVHNLEEAYQDASGQMRDMLVPGRFLYVYGIFFPEGDGFKFEAKHIVFLGRTEGDYLFEKPDWWVNQIRSLADWWLRAQWEGGAIDYRNYRTRVALDGVKVGDFREDFRQEVDTISRLVYGFASAYLLTGQDRFLEAAEKGTDYLRDHLRFIDRSENIVYWYHAIDVKGNHERKVLASEFGDDYDAIPAYEQIYALAGPTQTYRITGDPRIASDIEMTVNLFDKYFFDRERGGYFSHLDPITFNARSDTLGRNRARKNWNSVGDHAPAYLINAYLATGSQRYADFLAYTADTICDHFPDYDNSPFVQEKFHEDWSADRHWGWQQNRAVVGHNLKIAWNLMRINSMRPSDKYVALARKIAELMPKVGMDKQRGGWYDVVERTLGPGEEYHRYVWHDRKAWWQQEQGILAYQILSGTLGDPDYLRLARESAAFYNAWFLDHDDGEVFFNTLANGIAFLQGTERLKGSHSKSGYHAFELAYLSQVYINLLITKEPLDLYFKPKPVGFPDNILRVQPDILPPGAIKITDVWINDEPYGDFDAENLTVKLPQSTEDVRVRVRVAPTQVAFSADFEQSGKTAFLKLTGNLDLNAIPALNLELQRAIGAQPQTLVIDMKGLEAISNAGVRALIFAKEKMGVDIDLFAIGCRDEVKSLFEQAEFTEDISFVEEYDRKNPPKRR